MANIQKYWIESITFPDDPLDESDIGTAVLSTADHGACIEIYGSKHALTERVIKVLNGLNGELGVKS